MSGKRSPLGVIFFTVFVSMVSFGIVIPVLPVYGMQDPFKLSPSMLGSLVGVFSLVQLVAAPLLGKLSDKIGRKPVLLLSVIGTVVGFLIIGRAETVWMLFLGRIIDGASGGNIATAQACIVDVTAPENRSKAMGMIGAAFGLGFVMGPALGGVLSKYSHAMPFYFAAGLSVLNALLIWIKLPETYPVERRQQGVAKINILDVFRQGNGSVIGILLLASLLSTTGFAFIHLLFSTFCRDRFNWSQTDTGWAFAYVGLVAVFVQGGLLRRLLHKNIEKQLAGVGALILAISLAWLPFTHTLTGFLGSCALMALGNGLLTPTLTGMASRIVSGDVQGRLLGIMAAAGSLGRFLGPKIAAIPLPENFSQIDRPLQGPILEQIDKGYEMAFMIGAILIAASMVCVLLIRNPSKSNPVAEPVQA